MVLEEMKEKNKKRVFQKNQKLLEIKLFKRNLIKEINTRVESLGRYPGLLEIRKRRTQTDGPKNNEIYDNAKGLKPEVSRKEVGGGDKHKNLRDYALQYIYKKKVFKN